VVIRDSISIVKYNLKKRIKPLRPKGLPEDLRLKIKEARLNRGWGQRELGAQVGLPQPHISAIESGEIVPRFDTLLDLVRVLEQDILLVPRALVPAVQSLIRAHKEPAGSEERPLYATDEEEPGPKDKRRNEF
jgi:transcriptional regulator with XRE-family HTH domain